MIRCASTRGPFTGTGQTVNASHPVVRDLILAALRYWVMEMHVDGFRFALASVLGRNCREVREVPARRPPQRRCRAGDIHLESQRRQLPRDHQRQHAGDRASRNTDRRVEFVCDRQSAGVDAVLASNGDMSNFSGYQPADPQYQLLFTQIHDGVLKAGKFLGAVTYTYGRPGPPGTGRADFADWRLFYTGPSFDGWQPPRPTAR